MASGTDLQNESTGARRLSDTRQAIPTLGTELQGKQPPRSSGRGVTVERNYHSHCRQQQGTAWIHGGAASRPGSQTSTVPSTTKRRALHLTNETPPKATGRGAKAPSLFTHQSSGEPQGWKAGLFPDLASDPAGNSQGLEGHQHNRALFACSPPSLTTQAAGTMDCKTCPCLHAVWWEWPVTYITLENSTHHRVTRQMQAWMWQAARPRIACPCRNC